MDIVLRFAALRGSLPTETPALPLATDSDFQAELKNAVRDPAAQGGVEAIAKGFVDSGFLADLDQAAHGTALKEVLDRVRAGGLAGNKLPAAVEKATDGDDPAAFERDRTRARDSVVAAYVLADAPDASAAAELVRGYALVEAVQGGAPSGDLVASIAKGPMTLPDFLAAPRVAPAPAPGGGQTAKEIAGQINELHARRTELANAVEELSLHAEDELDLSEGGERLPLRDLYRGAPEELDARGGRAADDHGNKVPTGSPDDAAAGSPLLRASLGRNVALSTRALELLPGTVTETFDSLELDPSTASVAEMRQRVADEHVQVGQQLMTLSGQLAKFSPIDVDASAVFPYWHWDPVDAPEQPPPLATAPPTTHTAVKPLGVADLVLVRAHVDHYERAEVAAVENVLGHEKLTHTVRRLDTVETSTTSEQETTDLRSQMQTTAEQNNESTKVEAVGPGLGPLAAAGPTSFAQSVTDQVSSSSTSRARTVTLERHVRETEETLQHEIDDSDVQQVAYGVYQWLDKVYTAQAYTFGARLLYDLIVPEPAGLYRNALARPRSGLPLPVRPAPFTVSPYNLTADNWAYYAAGHHADGVDAPPAAEVVVTEPFGGRAKDPFASDSTTCTLIMAEARSTRIPKGYRADRYRVVVQATGYDAGCVKVSIGAKSFTLLKANGVYVRSGRLDGETETLPVSVEVESNGVDWGVLQATIGVEVICKATDELFTAWQVKTHAQILAGNEQRFRDFEQAVATRDATSRAVLQGLTPTEKQRLIRVEMQRAALELLTGQSFAGFNATAFDAAGFPYPSAAATTALAAYTRFFEQAIEWEHLAYTFYPYFWGSQPSWVAKLLLNEPDAQFAAFLNSGAARVVLPVRPGYEAAVDRFLNTGVTPTSDELLDVGGPLWVSLVDELRSDEAEDGQETAVGDPWEFRIATDLVRARPDGSMPRWKRVGDEWQDTADPEF